MGVTVKCLIQGHNFNLPRMGNFSLQKGRHSFLRWSWWRWVLNVMSKNIQDLKKTPTPRLRKNAVLPAKVKNSKDNSNDTPATISMGRQVSKVWFPLLLSSPNPIFSGIFYSPHLKNLHMAILGSRRVVQY